MRLAIAYYRVSTKRQGRSHLGLDAQEAAIAAYSAANGYTLLHEIQEVKSTRKHRPGLQEALTLCREKKITLMAARLDRLGRDVEEIARVVKSGIDIIVTDNPHANRFTIHILAAVAEENRRTIGENTRAALQAAKRKGKRLGRHGEKLAKKNKRNADEFAKSMLPVIKSFAPEGIISVRAIASELNKRKVPTFRPGAQWHATSVQNLLARVK